MKKILVLLCLTVCSIHLMAEGYSYLTFTEADGSKHSFSVTDLVITFDGGSLKAVNSDGNFSLSLADLVKMAFTDEPTAIESVTTDVAVKVYSLEGLYIGEYQSSEEACAGLPRGLYILKSNGVASKISVR